MYAEDRQGPETVRGRRAGVRPYAGVVPVVAIAVALGACEGRIQARLDNSIGLATYRNLGLIEQKPIGVGLVIDDEIGNASVEVAAHGVTYTMAVGEALASRLMYALVLQFERVWLLDRPVLPEDDALDCLMLVTLKDIDATVDISPKWNTVETESSGWIEVEAVLKDREGRILWVGISRAESEASSGVDRRGGRSGRWRGDEHGDRGHRGEAREPDGGFLVAPRLRDRRKSVTRRSSCVIAATAVLSVAIVGACSPGFQSNVTPIKNPMDYRIAHREGGLQIGFDFLSVEEQIEHFGVDMTKADVVPVRIVVRNDDRDEFYIQADQIFGETADGDLYPAYRLDQTIERVRRSELGKAMVRGAVSGVLVGAAVGAATGSVIGNVAYDDGGGGAAIGAATLGTAGGLTGADAAMDSTSRAIKKELRKVDWGDRVVYPGRIEHGFLFMKPGAPYEALDMSIYNVNERRNSRIVIRIQ